MVSQSPPWIDLASHVLVAKATDWRQMDVLASPLTSAKRLTSLKPAVNISADITKEKDTEDAFVTKGINYLGMELRVISLATKTEEVVIITASWKEGGQMGLLQNGVIPR